MQRNTSLKVRARPLGIAGFGQTMLEVKSRMAELLGMRALGKGTLLNHRTLPKALSVLPSEKY